MRDGQETKKPRLEAPEAQADSRVSGMVLHTPKARKLIALPSGAAGASVLLTLRHQSRRRVEGLPTSLNRIDLLMEVRASPSAMGAAIVPKPHAGSTGGAPSGTWRADSADQ